MIDIQTDLTQQLRTYLESRGAEVKSKQYLYTAGDETYSVELDIAAEIYEENRKYCAKLYINVKTALVTILSTKRNQIIASMVNLANPDWTEAVYDKIRGVEDV